MLRGMDSKTQAFSQVKIIKSSDLIDIYSISYDAISRLRTQAKLGKNGLEVVEYFTTRGDKRLGLADTPENHEKIRKLVQKGRKSINKRYRR